MDQDACRYLASTCPNAKFQFHNSKQVHTSVKEIGRQLDDLTVTFDTGDNLGGFYDSLTECSNLSAFSIKSLHRRQWSLREKHLFGCWMEGICRLEIHRPILAEM